MLDLNGIPELVDDLMTWIMVADLCHSCWLGEKATHIEFVVFSCRLAGGAKTRKHDKFNAKIGHTCTYMSCFRVGALYLSFCHVLCFHPADKKHNKYWICRVFVSASSIISAHIYKCSFNYFDNIVLGILLYLKTAKRRISQPSCS